MWKKEVKLHAIHNQKRKATQGQRDLARQRPLPIRSSTSAFFSSGQEWLYPGSELLVPVVQSISVQPLRREPWGIRLNPRLGALQLSQLKLFLP